MRKKEREGKKRSNAGIEFAIFCPAANKLLPPDIIARTIILISIAKLNFHDLTVAALSPPIKELGLLIQTKLDFAQGDTGYPHRQLSCNY